MTEPLDLDAIQARADAATDPSGCGSCRHHTDRGRAAIHEQCIARAQLIPAPDAPCYETILDTPEDQRANLPARFHTPVWDGNGTPNGWHCVVCWGDGWSTAWPCATATEYGGDVFTPEHLTERARQDVPAMLAEIRWLRAALEHHTALDLGAPDGRVSATCDNSEHPTWLRKPDDTRGCPWCELDQTRKQSESCDHESWEAGPRRLIGRKAVQSRRCADCGEQLPPYPIQIS